MPKINITLDPSVFNPAFLPFIHDEAHKFLILLGGAGSGKSVAVAQKLILRAAQRPNYRCLVVRNTGRSLKESCFKLICDQLSKWQLLAHCKINQTDLTITLWNGSAFLMKGLDDVEKIKSIVNIHDVWCEESSEIDESSFDQLVLRARAPGGLNQIICSTNPTSKAWFGYTRWFAPDAKPTEDTYILRTTYKDNGFLPRSYIDSLEAMINTNPVYYKIYALGEFCSLDRLIYNNWRVESFDYRALRGEHIVGLDFGFSADPTACIQSIAVDKKLYVFSELVEQGLTNDMIAKRLQALGILKSPIIADSAEPKSIEELKRAGAVHIKSSKKGPDSINHGIQRLQQFEIIVHPSCTRTIEELENYSWKKDKNGEYTDKPVDAFNHCLDALRYSIQGLKNNSLTAQNVKSILRL